ncbi:SLAIN motif-containing protein-like isoform X2 [Cololabis saira]|uniref:SLAIN motif-containing protein-like isoform X2 n=1 Tax=Cololabis saira TaxID=129043 RepID=UPI002AD581B4|nr:SLAIN motif-containing protein-like isoform X2 [Cololabis saira]
MRRIEDFKQKLELQDHVKIDWCQYFYNQVEFESKVHQDLHSSELKVSCGQLKGRPDPLCTAWTECEGATVMTCKGRSFAMDARLRLDSLKSGCSAPIPRMGSPLHRKSCDEDAWDGEETENEESALDLVEILHIEDDGQDEESWLYEPARKQLIVEKEPALRWCRRVLDNPTPDMEAACRMLVKKLDQRSRHLFYTRAAASRVSEGSSEDKTPDSTAFNDPDGDNRKEPNISDDPTTTPCRLHDITDIHIMAQIQEASLRQDFVSTPPAPSFKTNPEPQLSNPSAESLDEFSAGNNVAASSSSRWQPGSSLSTSPRLQPPTLIPKPGCQSPKMTRLHQQVTQFKLLKLAQNQASPGRTRSPLQTSLRSLQAVRNSRSLETESSPLSGGSSTSLRSCCGSSSLSPASLNSSGFMHPMKDSSVRITAMKGVQRSQSLSPCRIPHPAKGYLSVHGRVFASPERPATAAWGRLLPSLQH